MAKLKTRAEKGRSEASIENAVCKYARSLGIKQCKFTSPGHRSVPDRIFFPAGGRPFLIEFKREIGGKLTVGQTREIEELKALGYDVYVCNDVPLGKDILDTHNALS